VDDELGESNVETVVRKGKLFGRPGSHVDVGTPRSRRRDERLGRIDRRDGIGSETSEELLGQSPRSAPDIQRALTGVRGGKLGELHGQRF
jgi:hypothetical protein